MTKVLITGGAGFVGRHLVGRLLDLGWEVKVIDNLTAGTGAIHPSSRWPLFNPLDYSNFAFEKLDCRQFFQSDNNEQFDYIFHLAAIVGGRLTIENNPLAVASDLAIDSDMWSWATTGKVSKVVNFSSSAAYPVDLQASTSEIVALKESDIDLNSSIGLPDLTYGWAKLTSEYLGKIAWERYGIRSIVYRPFSGYGPDQDLSYPFPSICKRAIDSEKAREFKVWGSGKQSRDFIHIEDCISGILQTMDSIDNGEALNLSTGIATSFIEFAHYALDEVGSKAEILGDETKPTGVKSRVGDTKKQLEFGFKPTISFRQGVRECLEYFSKSF